MEENFQIFLVLLGVLAFGALLARRLDVAPAVLLLAMGVGLAFVPGLPALELPPTLVLLVVLPPLIYSASVAMSWREFPRQSAPDHIAGDRLCAVHRLRRRHCHALCDRLALGHRLLLGAIVAPPDVVAPLAIARNCGCRAACWSSSKAKASPMMRPR